MSMKKAKKYLLGIDLGTDSCGFCLCDENSHIVKKQGKYLWGVRLFDEAQDAKKRRTFRASRRRLQRRNQRIKLLQELFADEIFKVDQNFYKRLTFSQIKKEEAEINGLYFDYSSTLFNDSNLNDKIYFKDYPTIYHLRKDLIEEDRKFDIREIYLACAHLLKHRGNFLYDNLEMKGYTLDFKEIIINAYFEIFKYFYEDFNDQNFILEITDKTLNKYKDEHRVTYRKSYLKEFIFNNEYKNKDFKGIADIFTSLLSGSNVDFKKIYKIEKFGYSDQLDDFDEEFLKKQFDFDDEKFELSLEEFDKSQYINDELLEFSKCIRALKRIYDNLILQKLLGDSNYISKAMCLRYEKHEEQLKEFKEYVKDNKPELYNEIFRKVDLKDDKLNNYPRYIGSNNTNNIKERFYKCSQNDFYNYIKTLFDLKKVKNLDNINDPYLKKIFDLMSSNDFLVKQRTGSNSVFPYQLAEYELRTILNNQAKYYPFLTETKDKYGTVLDKVLKIISFKIPYYVGPLTRIENDENHEFKKYSWAEFKENDGSKITPWNFDDIIDKEASNKKFIRRMLNNCSYLHSDEDDCKCLPKHSPLIEYVNVLNELNKMIINDKEITFEIKHDLLKNVYLKKNKVKAKDLKDYLKVKYNSSTVNLNYVNSEKEFKIEHDLSTFNNLAKILELDDSIKEEYLKNGYIKNLEDIVSDISVFEDKTLLKEHFLKNLTLYGIKEEQVKSLAGLNFKDFARLSRKLLIDIHPVDENGVYLESKNIIKEMINSNKNFMEIVGTIDSEYKLAIDNFNIHNNENKKSGDFIKDYVNELYVSPGMKRPLIQAYKIAKELEKIIGTSIDEFYIECPRSNDNKKEEKLSRKANIENLYKSAKEFTNILTSEEFDKLKNKMSKCDENKFRSDEIYLYFTQLGRDIYTKEPIIFNSLANGIYDIDHIYPQSLIKDDSLNNRVLTSKYNNQDVKKDNYPINYDAFKCDKFKYDKNDVLGFQKLLYEKGLIKKEKLDRLQRRTPLSDEELYNFVNRQIVYTSQSVKALKDVFESMSDENHKVNVIMSKAEVVSDFRKKYDIVKARDANNLHHAHDAFLNVVVGRTVDTYFTKNIFKRMNKDNELDRKKYTTNVMKVFDDYNGDIHKANIVDKEGIVWDYNNSLNYVKEQVYKNFNMLITTRTYIKPGFFSKTTIKSAKKLKGFGLATKGSFNENKPNLTDYQKYGGFSDLSFANYMLIKGKKGKEEVTAIVTYPSLYENDIKLRDEFIYKIYSIKNFNILVSNLNVNTVIEVNNSKFCITGKKNARYNIKNLKETYFDERSLHIIKLVTKSVEYFTMLKVINKNRSIKEEFFNEHKHMFINNHKTFIISPAKNNKTKELVLNYEDLDYLFNFMLNRIKSKDLSFYSSSELIYKMMLKFKKQNNLNILDFLMLNYEILIYLQTNTITSNLLMIGGAKGTGELNISCILPFNSKIIFESVTGYYRKVIWENK